MKPIQGVQAAGFGCRNNFSARRLGLAFCLVSTRLLDYPLTGLVRLSPVLLSLPPLYYRLRRRDASHLLSYMALYRVAWSSLGLQLWSSNAAERRGGDSVDSSRIRHGSGVLWSGSSTREAHSVVELTGNRPSHSPSASMRCSSMGVDAAFVFCLFPSKWLTILVAKALAETNTAIRE